MRLMRWSYSDLCECPRDLFDAIVAIALEESEQREHDALMAEARRVR